MGAPAGTIPNPASGPAASAPTEFGLIKEAWDTIHQQYVARDELDDRELIYGAIDGLTEAVGDTGHTDFMTPEERKERDDALSGSYVGIGVRIDETEEGLPRVVSVFKGSPAEAAGLKSDDVIVAVDGRKTAGQTIDEVAELGPRRGGHERRADGPERRATAPSGPSPIVRADVPIEPVSWTMVPGSTTALIRLEQFSTGAADDVVQALNEARAAGADRIVLDLRGNPGGYVNEAVGIASQFLTSGIVYIERNAAATSAPSIRSRPAASRPTCRWSSSSTADTASSSEIVSGALQDAGRAEDRRRDDVRHRHRPRRVRALGRLGAADRDRGVADARRPTDLARGHRPGRARSRCRTASCRSPRTRSGSWRRAAVVTRCTAREGARVVATRRSEQAAPPSARSGSDLGRVRPSGRSGSGRAVASGTRPRTRPRPRR